MSFYHKKVYHIEQDGKNLSMLFVRQKDAINWANDNLVGNYILIKEEIAGDGWRKPMKAWPIPVGEL